MATVDSIYDKIKGYTQYSGLSEDELYNIASELYKKSVYQTLSLFYSSQASPFSPFRGENASWGQFTYTEIIQMEEQGVLIPEEVLAWAHSMQDADCTNYDSSETCTSDDASGLEQETADSSKESELITLKKTARALINKCRDNGTVLTSQIEVLDALKKEASVKQLQAEDMQGESLSKIQNIVDEWTVLESKLRRNIPLSDAEQKRFDELSTLLSLENKKYVNEMNAIDFNFSDIASELNEIDILNQNTTDLSNEAERVGRVIATGEARHSFTSTSDGVDVLTGIDSVIISSSLSKNLAQTAIQTGIMTNILTADVQTEVNEVASLIDLKMNVTSKVQIKNPELSEVSDTKISNTEEQVKDEAESEFQDEENAQENIPTQKIKAPSASPSVAPITASVQTRGTAGIAEGSGITETSTSTVEDDTLATDNTEESGNELKAQTQEQIEQCNTRSSEITNAINAIDPIKKAVQDIRKESKLQSKLYDAEIGKSLQEYQTLCDKLKNGEELSPTEEATFKKLNGQLDKTNGDYVNKLDANINILSTYTRSIGYAFDIVTEGFEIANTTVETGKQLAIQELGDRSYLLKTFFFMLLSDERQKDLLYGKVGESLGRDAIERGELLAQESTDANTVLSRQIPLANFAQKECENMTDKKNTFVDRVTEITKDVPGLDDSGDNKTEEDNVDKKAEEQYGVNDRDVLKITGKSLDLTKDVIGITGAAIKTYVKSAKDAASAKQAQKVFEAINEKQRQEEERVQKEIEEKKALIKEEEKKIKQEEEGIVAKDLTEDDDKEEEDGETKTSRELILQYKNEIAALEQGLAAFKEAINAKRMSKMTQLNKDIAKDKKVIEDCKADSKEIAQDQPTMDKTITLGTALAGVGAARILLGEELVLTGSALMSNPFTFKHGAMLVYLGTEEIVAGTTSLIIGVNADATGIAGNVACKVGDVAVGSATNKAQGAVTNAENAITVVSYGLTDEQVASTAAADNSEQTGEAGENTDETANTDETGSTDETETTDETAATETDATAVEETTDPAGAAVAEETPSATGATSVAAVATSPAITAASKEFQQNNIVPLGIDKGTQKQANKMEQDPPALRRAPKAEGQATEETKVIEGGKKDKQDNGQAVNAKNGKQAAQDCKKSSSDGKQKTRESEENTREMEKTDKAAQKSDKRLQKSSKTLSKQIQKDQKELEQTEKQVDETSNKIAEEEMAITLLQMEVEGLTASEESQGGGEQQPAQPAQPAQAASPMQPMGDDETGAIHAGFDAMAGVTESTGVIGAGSDGAGAQSDTQTKIQDLNSQIEVRSIRVGLYSDKLVKFQNKSAKTIKRMKRTNKKYNKAVKKEQKQKKEDVKTSEKIMKKAEQYESVFSTIATYGFIVGTTGDILSKIVLPPWIPIVGAIMAPIGHAAEAIGNYGVAAANLTKCAVLAAQGNLKGALMSAGMAIMSGASAVSATGQATKGFQNMGKNIAAAQARATALKAAKSMMLSNDTMTKTLGTFLKSGIKSTAKKEMKQVLKQAGKKLLMNAGNLYQEGSKLFAKDDKQDTGKKKEYKKSARFQEIQRKNAKRRANIHKKRGY